tara:strand:- start:1108 stop:2103 length:996 start_codon:yes stop_codon:yes gene_type:complete
MKNIIFFYLLTSSLIFNVHAETVHLTCMGKDISEVESDSKIGSFYPSVKSFMSFRWIKLDKQNKSILLAGDWIDTDINLQDFTQKWHSTENYSEDIQSISFKYDPKNISNTGHYGHKAFKESIFSINRDELTLTENTDRESYPLKFKCYVQSQDQQEEHRIAYWQGEILKNKISIKTNPSILKIGTDRVHLTCFGKTSSISFTNPVKQRKIFRWIILDKKNKSILLSGDWIDSKINSNDFSQIWHSTKDYSENMRTINFKFNPRELSNTLHYNDPRHTVSIFSINREKLTLREHTDRMEYPLKFKCHVQSQNEQEEHLISYWKEAILNNKI